MIASATGSLDRPALTAASRSLEAELLERTTAGARVAITATPGPNWAVALCACLGAGRAAIPVGPGWGDSLRASLVADCSVVLDDRLVEAHLAGPQGRPGSAGPGPAGSDPDSASILVLTSGTGGAPEMVELKARNLRAQAHAGSAAVGLRAGERWLSSLPLSHTGGIGVVIRCLRVGATAVLRPALPAAEAVELLAGRSEPIALVSLVPTTLQRLLDAGLDRDHPLRLAIVGGAPLSPSLRERAIEAGVPVVETWGMTQTCGMATIERVPGEGGAGSPLDGIEIRIAGDGEVLVRGGQVADGALAPDGWLHSGDLGRFEGGCLRIEGRKSSTIISGGENIQPERIEAVISGFPGVTGVIVTGEPDPEWGERVVALVEAPDGVAVADLEEHCRRSLSRWEVPKRLSIVDALPLGETGKPLRGVAGGSGSP